ncbi:MAG: amidase family protein [Burkholderiaceae bacterium]
MHTPWWARDAAQIARCVRAGEVSALEVARAALARIDAVNPRINAVVDCRPDEVLDAARAIDARRAAGDELGPLAGVPVTVKCNIDQAGHATTNGLLAQRDLIAAEDSPVVTNLRRAGAVILGRTNTPTVSYRWFTSNRLHGATRNPRDPSLTPGGSSGGAAAALAAGIGAIAHGTDIAGSIRYPAYACGVHGLRPSFGRVAAFNATTGERPIGPQILAVSGPLARTVADLRIALEALAGPDARDPWWVPAPLHGPALPRRAVLCLRPEGLPTDPAVCEALLEAAARLRDAGWQVDEVDALPPMGEGIESHIRLWMGDGYAQQVRDAQADGDPGAIAALAGQAAIGQATDAQTLSQALKTRATIARAWHRYLAEHPVVLLPVSAELPFPDQLDLQGPDAYARVWRAQLTMIALPLAGVPAISLCTGRHGTRPVGVQIVAPRFREDLCLDAAEAIESRGQVPQPQDPA